MAAFDPATLDRWRALAIVDRDGSTVGTISEFYLDRETGHPTWALVNTGLFGTTQTFVPLVHATEISDGLQVPYEKRHIKDSPRVDLHDELSPDEEATLFAHYGVEYQLRPTTDAEAGPADTEREPGEALDPVPAGAALTGSPAAADPEPGAAASPPGRSRPTQGRSTPSPGQRPPPPPNRSPTSPAPPGTTRPGSGPATRGRAGRRRRFAGRNPRRHRDLPRAPRSPRTPRSPSPPGRPRPRRDLAGRHWPRLVPGRARRPRPGPDRPGGPRAPRVDRGLSVRVRPANDRQGRRPVRAPRGGALPAARRGRLGAGRRRKLRGAASRRPSRQRQRPLARGEGGRRTRADRARRRRPARGALPLERARRRLERLVGGGQDHPDPEDISPADRDAAERARRARLGLDEEDHRRKR